MGNLSSNKHPDNLGFYQNGCNSTNENMNITNQELGELIQNIRTILEEKYSSNDIDIRKEREPLISGGLIKVAFLGRNDDNRKLLSSLFIDEPYREGINLYTMNEVNKYKVHSPSEDNKLLNVSDACGYFSNLNGVNFFANFFTSFYKAPSFSKNTEFKMDIYCADYEKCIDIDLKELSQLITYLSENDLVIFVTDKNNENIVKEAKYFDYLIKRFPIIKNSMKNKKFLVVLNTETSHNCLYKYQNEEANKIFDRINQMFEHNVFFELNVEKCYEEKIIYFHKLLLNTKINPIQRGQTCKTHKINSDGCEDPPAVEQLINDHYPNFKLKVNSEAISNKFEEIIKQKFKILHSKNFNYNADNYKTKKFEKFYQNYVQSENYYSFDLNKIREFDKVIFDGIMNELYIKLDSIFEEIEVKHFLSSEESQNFINRKDLNIDEVKNKISKSLTESFDYVSRVLNKNTDKLLEKFRDFLAKIEGINKIIVQRTNLKGEPFNKSRFAFLLEVFDMYGLKHYFTSLSIEAINTYNSYMKKLYLKNTNVMNTINVTFDSLERNIVLTYEELKNNIETINQIDISKIHTDRLVKSKLNGSNFFNVLLFKAFSIKRPKYKPMFAFYNIANIIGIIAAAKFINVAIRKLIKYQPNTRKIFTNVLYACLTILVSYIFSVILNNVYNKKSEKQFFKLIKMLATNLRFTINQLNNYKNSVESFKKNYSENALALLSKVK